MHTTYHVKTKCRFFKTSVKEQKRTTKGVLYFAQIDVILQRRDTEVGASSICEKNLTEAVIRIQMLIHLML